MRIQAVLSNIFRIEHNRSAESFALCLSPSVG